MCMYTQFRLIHHRLCNIKQQYNTAPYNTNAMKLGNSYAITLQCNAMQCHFMKYFALLLVLKGRLADVKSLACSPSLVVAPTYQIALKRFHLSI